MAATWSSPDTAPAVIRRRLRWSLICLRIAHKSCAIDLPSRKVGVSGDFLLRHYIRFIVKDRPGIIAQIAGALAKQEINIHAILQKPGIPKGKPAVCRDCGTMCRRLR